VRRLRLFDTLVGLLLLTLLLALRALDPAPLSALRASVFDFYQLIDPRDYEPVPVRIIALDDASLQEVGQWPWGRIEVAQLVDQLRAFGVAAIGFDVVFSEPDRTAPQQLIDQWRGYDIREDSLEALSRLPDPDTIFSVAIRQVPTVLGFAPIPESTAALPRVPAGFANAGASPVGIVPSFAGATTPVPLLEGVAAGTAALAVARAGQGGTIRQVPLLLDIGDTVTPTLGVETLRVALGASTYVTRATDASGEAGGDVDPQLVALRVGPFDVPTTGDGGFYVHYTEHVPERFVPAWRVMRSDPSDPELRALLEGHLVLVGATAAGLQDLRATPLNPFEPGVTIHAQVIEQILTQHYLIRPDWADGAELLTLLVMGLVLVVALPRAGALTSAMIGGVSVLLAVGASWYAYSEELFLLDAVGPSLTALSLYIVLTLLTFIRTDRDKVRVRRAFSQYLAPELVSRLAEDPSQLVLGGESRDVSVLFCDIRGFTTLSEKLDPQALARFLNRFLTPMTDAILSAQGTIDKYMGDAIMAFWNAPLELPEHARHACEAALEMRRRLVAFNADAEALAGLDGIVRIGIGINTGPATVGNFGSEQRFDYSVLGDTVNLASRLEGQSKTFGVDLVVGEETARAIGDWALLELDLIRVKGKFEPVRVFTVIGDTAMVTPDFGALRERHEQMLAAYRGQHWSAALDHLAEARRQAGQMELGLDLLYDLYAERIRTNRADPPPADWDGVFVATEK